MKLTSTNNSLTLEYNNKIVFSHTEKTPFVESMKCILKYKSLHGTFSIKEKLENIVPLSKFEVKENTESLAVVDFYQDSKKLTVTITESDLGLRFTFENGDNGSYQFNFKGSKTEGIFGGGEQFRKLNLKGELVENFVSEHIKVFPIVQKTIFKFLPYKAKEHKDIETYAPMTTFVSSEKYAIRVDVECYGIQDFTKGEVNSFRYELCPVSILYTTGESYKDIAKKLAIDIPNNEFLPDWAYDGLILGVQGGIDRVEGIADKLLQAGANVNGVWCQDWSGKKITAVGSQVYWNWIVDEKVYPDLKNRIAKLNKKGVHFLAYINPYLVKDGTLYNHCKENDMLIKDKKGEIYHIVATTFKAGMMDLTNPKMVEYLQETIIKKNMLDLGIEGYMADFGEYLPVDCVLHDGDPEILHNTWTTLWAKINREAVESHPNKNNVFFYTRSGYNNAQKYTTTMWSGDQHVDWTVDYGMPCVIPATMSLGFSGMTVVHSDIGGFTSFRSMARDAEVVIRWMEMNTFSPLMRGHETIRPDFNVQYDDPKVIDYTVKFSKIHEKIKPYLLNCHAQANEGIPFMRPDFYNDNDFALHQDMYSYSVGDDLFVAPVLEANVNVRKVSLPKGEWKHLFTKKVYSGSFEVEAPLGEPAVFYKVDSEYKELFDNV